MNTRTWAEINLDSLKDNIKEIRRITSEKSKIMAIVKADAYGHGAVECSKVLLKNGANMLGVACCNEAMQLRNAGIDAPILILGASFEEEIEELILNNIAFSIFSYEFAKKVSEIGEKLKKNAIIHIKLDTGMSRIGYVTGVNDDEVVNEIVKISELPYIEIEGIFSHFATADEKDSEYTELQFGRFNAVCEKLNAVGVNIPIRHIANSAAIMMYPNTHLDMVRAGVILYGLYPSDDVDKSRLKLKSVMSVKSRITHIKEICDNRGVSYGKTYITGGNTKIATVPVGYADGYTRLLGGKAKILVNDEPKDVIGRICMDQCMIDVTNVNNINVGDEVVIFGEETVTADTLASWMGTINYEIVCMISKRIPRIYSENGRMVSVLNYLGR